jgi:glycosyltransferase involved in cell wall biosynthesis
MNYSIIIPIYNEEENILTLNQEISNVIRENKIDNFQLIYVDDCSTDRSFEQLKKLTNNFETKILKHRINLSQSEAIRTGINYSRYENLVFLDADLQNDPKDINLMIIEFRKGYDMVIGARKNRQDNFFSKKLPSYIANYIVKKFTNSKANDHGCALKILKKNVYDISSNLGDFHRLLAAEAYSHGFKIKEIDVNHRKRKHGKSNYGFSRIFKVTLDIIYLGFSKNYNGKRLYFFGQFGLICFLISFFLFLWMLYIKYFEGRSFILTPLPTLASTFFLMSLNFLLIGILAQILDTKKKEEKKFVETEIDL